MGPDVETAKTKTVTGRPASAGLFRGPVCNFRKVENTAREKGSLEEEKTALSMAISAALQDVERLVANTDDADAAAILEFQAAFLDDDALGEPAVALIESGMAANDAFKSVIDEMAGEYETAEDEYFAARASDIRDLGARVLRRLHGQNEEFPNLPEGSVLLADDMAPSAFLSHDWQGRAILLRQGSPSAHVAMLARSRGIPMVVGLADLVIEEGACVLIDGDSGDVCISPDKAMERKFAERIELESSTRMAEEKVRLSPVKTASGEAVAVYVNIADPSELEALDVEACDGIGLVRTELLFYSENGLPDEGRQFETYAKILKWAGTRPVTIRLLDAGGDKPISGLTLENEQNPFLGLRGVRLLLQNREVLKVQLRALLRAAVHGNLQIMVPMISVPEEMEQVRSLLEEVKTALGEEGISHGEARLGMMVEVPSTVFTLERFDADFFSIGSNDLTQYIMAAGRDSLAMARLADTASPAVLLAIEMVVKAAAKASIPVSLCGDAAGDKRVLPMLLQAGLRSFSVAPKLLGRTKLAISGWGEKS